jgi:poly(A) polymerase
MDPSKDAVPVEDAAEETQPVPPAVAGGNVIDRGAHPISRRSIPENVLKVLYRLHRSGYRAYL